MTASQFKSSDLELLQEPRGSTFTHQTVDDGFLAAPLESG